MLHEKWFGSDDRTSKPTVTFTPGQENQINIKVNSFKHKHFKYYNENWK